MKLLNTFLFFFIMTVSYININAQVAVIANKNFPSDTIDNKTLKSFYEITSNEMDGNKIVLYNLISDDKTTNKFYEALGTSLHKIKRLWLRAKLTGNGKIPRGASSEDMVKQIASTSGAIGFVPLDKVDGDVKIILQIN